MILTLPRALECCNRIGEILDFSLTITDLPAARVEETENADSVRSFQNDNEAGSPSVGQRQLITIARVFLCDPPAITFDEVTSGVDTRTEVEIGKAMKTLMSGRTSFVIAHRLSTICDADIILFQESGNISKEVIRSCSKSKALTRHCITASSRKAPTPHAKKPQNQPKSPRPTRKDRRKNRRKPTVRCKCSPPQSHRCHTTCRIRGFLDSIPRSECKP